MSLTNIFTGITNTTIEISNVSITLKSSFMVPAINSPKTHTLQVSGNHWSSFLLLLPTLEFLTNGIIVFRMTSFCCAYLVHSFLKQTGIPFVWLCHHVYPSLLLLHFRRTVLSYREVGQRKVKTRVNREIFITDVKIS